MANYKDQTLETLSIRVTPRQKARLEELKATHGYSVQELVRRALDYALWDQVVAEIPKTGVNSPNQRRKVAYR